jgi:hypothetical protein
MLALGGLLTSAGIAQAPVTVTLYDTSQTTSLTANVSKQARVIVPASVTFLVANVSSGTAAPAASVTIDNIVLATATKR